MLHRLNFEEKESASELEYISFLEKEYKLWKRESLSLLETGKRGLPVSVFYVLSEEINFPLYLSKRVMIITF